MKMASYTKNNPDQLMAGTDQKERRNLNSAWVGRSG